MDIDEINRLQAQIDALQAQVANMRAEAGGCSGSNEDMSEA